MRKSRSARRTKSFDLDKIQEILSHFNLREILKLSARLSLHESTTPEHDPLSISNILNFEHTRLLAHLVTTSGAKATRSSRLPHDDDFISILNSCIANLEDPRELSLLKLANPTPRAHLEHTRFLARMATIQIAAQEPNFRYRASRIISLLEVLPDKFPNEIPGSEQSKVLTTVSQTEAVLGARPSELLRGFLLLLTWQQRAAEASRIATAGRAGSIRRYPPYRDLLCSFLRPEPLLDEFFVFSTERILQEIEGLPPAAQDIYRSSLENFLNLASKSAKELSNLARTKQCYREGHPGKRLSPLERYPVVKLAEDGAGAQSLYVIPNHRHFVQCFDKIIDFSLSDALGAEYAHARGALLHLYLQKLIESRLPNTVVIPEFSYRSSRGEKRSPDLTIIEPSTKRIIAIEVKGRAVSFRARVNLANDMLDDLNDLYKAMGNLPRKIEDLNSVAKEFDRLRPSMALTGDSPPILLGVLRQGLPFGMGRLVREEIRIDPKNPLHSIKNPHCILDAETFERAVEQASRTQQPLSDLLLEYFRVIDEDDRSQEETAIFGDRSLVETSSLAREMSDLQCHDS